MNVNVCHGLNVAPPEFLASARLDYYLKHGGWVIT